MLSPAKATADAAGLRDVGVRKVVVYELLSLDGVAEDPDRFVSEWEPAGYLLVHYRVTS